MTMKKRDPVCGCSVDTSFSSRRHNHGGFEYYFCSDTCMGRFLEDPASYASPFKGS